MQYTDQLGRIIKLSGSPHRIISLVPSQTELLYTLGLDDNVVGITKFCIHPEKWRKSKAIVGGTKNIDRRKIDQLNPDLIIANKEENDKTQLEELMRDYNVWISDIKTLNQAFVMIESIGEITGHIQQATKLIASINTKFKTLASIVSSETTYNVAYLIWNKPVMVAGSDTFINEMLMCGGFKNCFATTERYPVLQWDDLQSCRADIIMLSTEPFPFSEKHLIQYSHILPDKRILIVDGEMFSWYGSRLLKAADYIINLRKSLRSSLNTA